MNLRQIVHDRSIEIGKLSVRMTSVAGSGHPSSALSLAHVVVALMYKQMRYDLSDPWNMANDRLVLSEGHAVPIIYAAYADLGGVAGKTPEQAGPLTVEYLDTLRDKDSLLDGHPNPTEGFPFFDAATGSLGQGLSVAAGLALAARLAGIDKRIYTICGDGESREGQIWEAADFVVDHKLTNVCLIVNCNGQGQADYVSHQQSREVLAEKFKAFGWEVRSIDGHDPDQIFSALSAVGTTARPYVIIAATEKGWGVDDLKGHTNHGKPLPADKMEAAFASLDAMRNKLRIGDKVEGLEQFRPPKPDGTAFKRVVCDDACCKLGDPDFDKLLAGDSKWEKTHKLATRRAYGLALRELGKINDRVVALDGDVSNSTFSNFFAKAFPDRFFECKIAEQNMVSVAAGLSAGGYVPFAHSFGKFLVRGYDQVEMAAISRANIKLVGSHVGVTLGADGPSQMALPDMAFFRAFSSVSEHDQPNLVIFNPADAVCAFKSVELMCRRQGMCYMRTMRPDTPLLYPPNETFDLGGVKVLAQGADLLIAATGYMVHVARKLLEPLKQKGVIAGLIDVYVLPFDGQAVLSAAEKSGNKILSLEDNYAGGLGSALAEVAAQAGNVKVHSLTVNRFPKSGKTPQDVLDMVGLSEQDILDAARKLAGK